MNNPLNSGVLPKIKDVTARTLSLLRKLPRKEAISLLLFAALLLVGLREMFPKRVFPGDLEAWYAIYHYFHESLINRTFALWNPYMNGGEPFWPVLGMWRMLDPLNFVFFFIERCTANDLLKSYHVYFLATIFVSLSGTYLLFRHIVLKDEGLRSIGATLPFFLFIAFSGMSFSDFLMDAYQTHYYVMPFLLYSLIRFGEGNGSKWLWLSAYFLGLYVGTASYHFVFGALLLVCCMLVSAIRGGRAMLRARLGMPFVHFSAACLLLLLLCSPMLSSYFEIRHHLYPIARTALDRALFNQAGTTGFDISYEAVMNTGLFVSPSALRNFVFTYPQFLTRLGLFVPLPFALIALFVIGVFFGRNEWKPHCLFMMAIASATIMGPSTPAHKWLCKIYPPLALARNGIFFLYYFSLLYSYFVLLGAAFIVKLSRSHASLVGRQFVSLFIASYLVLACLVGSGRFASGAPFRGATCSQGKFLADFDHRAQRFQYIGRRAFAAPRPDYLMDPILYKQNSALGMLATPYEGPSPTRTYYEAWDRLASPPSRYGATYGFRTFFWTKPYYNIYRWGERDIEVFNALMGVDKELLSFSDNAVVMDDAAVEKLASKLGGRRLGRILDNAIILHDRPSGEGLNVVDPGLDLAAIRNRTEFSYSVTRYKPDDLTLATTASKAGVLLFRDGYDRYWKAYVDGKPRQVLRANVGFKAIALAEGKHEVRFRYLPLPFLLSLGFFIVAVIGVPIAVAFLP